MGLPVVFFDIGGVLLTNGWDTKSRNRACANFGVNQDEFEERHKAFVRQFETGRTTLERYLIDVVFYEPRKFDLTEFRTFMFEESKVLDDSLEWLRAFAKQGKCRLFTLNNESRELHENRVKKFRLGEIFSGFITSCYLGEMKPDKVIYESALGIANPNGNAVLFIDDREKNVKAAEEVGIKALQYKGLESLKSFLSNHGLSA